MTWAFLVVMAIPGVIKRVIYFYLAKWGTRRMSVTFDFKHGSTLKKG